MQTRIYESDPFTAKPQDLLVTIDSDYRFEKKDELYIDRAERPLKVRIIDVRVHVTDSGSLSRDILALKLYAPGRFDNDQRWPFKKRSIAFSRSSAWECS